MSTLGQQAIFSRVVGRLAMPVKLCDELGQQAGNLHDSNIWLDLSPVLPKSWVTPRGDAFFSLYARHG